MDRGCHLICLLGTEYAMVDEVNIGVRDRIGFVIPLLNARIHDVDPGYATSRNTNDVLGHEDFVS